MSAGNTRSLVRAGVGILGVLTLALVVAPASAEQGRFYDRQGNPLPLTTYSEVESFLDSAEITSKEKISAGTNRHKRKVVLEKGGLAVRAILRTSYEIKDSPHGGFVDSYLSELAAYHLALLLGLDNVPPVVRRKGGALQIWIENATTDAARRKAGETPEDPIAFERQLMDMYVFDSLIANTDRNPGNIIIDADGKVWFIDQTRSFAGQEELRYLDQIEGVSRSLWERLQSVSDDEIRQTVGPYVKHYMPELLHRRRMLVEALGERIRTEGEEALLFEELRP